MPPPGRHRACCLAAGSLFLAAVVAVAVAVPVSSAARASSTAAAAAVGPDASGGRQLAAQPAVAAAGGAVQEAGPSLRQVPADAPACQGVRGLCSVPARMVTFPGTHNSNAIKTNFASIAEAQKLTFAEQLQAGARLFDLDFAGGPNGARFGHCTGCFCAFSTDPDQNNPAKVFATMAAFLEAHPHEVIVIGLSNINCGDKDAARRQLLGLLATSPLAGLLATQAVGASTTLGQLVDTRQRAVLVFYDEWATPAGHTVGGKFVPNQGLFRIYGESTTVDAKDAAAIDAQTAQRLLADVVRQLSRPQASLTLATPWRMLGLFPSTCLVCRGRDRSVCGAASCAEQANREAFVLYVLGKATSRWTRSRGDQSLLLPAFNGFQVDFLQPTPQSNVVAAARRLNEAAAWMFTVQASAAPKLGLGNCAWVLDDAAAAGGLACVHQGRVQVAELLGSQQTPVAVAAAGAGGRHRLLLQQEAGAAPTPRHVLLPGNAALSLRVFADGKLRREVKGVAGQAQLLDLSTTAQEVQLLWV